MSEKMLHINANELSAVSFLGERKEAATPPVQDVVLPPMQEHFSDQFFSTPLNQHAQEFAPGAEWSPQWQLKDTRTYTHGQSPQYIPERKRVDFVEAAAVNVTLVVDNRDLLYNRTQLGFDLANVMRYALHEKRVYFNHHQCENNRTFFFFYVDPFNPLYPEHAPHLQQDMFEFTLCSKQWIHLRQIIDCCSIAVQFTREQPLYSSHSFRGEPRRLAPASPAKTRPAPPPQDAEFGSRQRLVREKYSEVSEMLADFLVPEAGNYLRGKNVAFIQVKSPPALRSVQGFVEKLLTDPNIEIQRVTMPHSRKRQGQPKGFLLYVECATEEQNKYLCKEVYTKEFESFGIKCKEAVFKK